MRPTQRFFVALTVKIAYVESTSVRRAREGGEPMGSGIRAAGAPGLSSLPREPPSVFGLSHACPRQGHGCRLMPDECYKAPGQVPGLIVTLATDAYAGCDGRSRTVPFISRTVVERRVFPGNQSAT